jgi:tRNA A-37 threonylcarbamoyl transferase component Bud32
VDIDFDEFEKDCEDKLPNDNDKSDPDDYSLLTNENCSVKNIPLFSYKINVEKNKIENDFIRSNTKNKKNFGSTIITKTHKNYLSRINIYKSTTLNNKCNRFFNAKDESIFTNNTLYNNNTFNNIMVDEKDKISVINLKGIIFKNNVTNFNYQTNTLVKSFESVIGNNSKFISGDEYSEINSKQNFRADGTGGPPEKIENANKSKMNQIINKSHTDFSNPFKFKNKLINKNASRDDINFPKNEVLGQNNKLPTNLTKIGISGMKLSIMSLDDNNTLNISHQNNNNKIIHSLGNVNKFLSPDSAPFSLNGDFIASDIVFEGYIYRSDEVNHLKKYYTVLVGNDLFYFSNSKKSTLKGIHNLSGTYIFKDTNTIKVREEYGEKHNAKNSNEKRNESNYNPNMSQISNINNSSGFGDLEGNLNKKKSYLNLQNDKSVTKTVYYYPFKLYFKKKCRVYYCVSEEDVKNWVDKVRTVTKFREITDHYIIGEELGHGKFGTVKVGNLKRKLSKNNINIIDNNTKEEEKFAIKIISKINLKSIELELVKSEIEIMKFCRYGNIVKLIENYEDNENIYIILEYLSGGNLNNYLSSQKTLLTENKIKELTLQIASGINYLHHFGIIHRDLKPENIMMSDKTINAIVKIVDFGLSKVLGIFEKSNEAYGTLAYAAPEVIQKSAYNKTIDIWSLGVILYFLISGQFPFIDKNNNLHKIALEITSGEIKFIGNSWKRANQDSKELVLSCLERDVNKRIDILNFINHKWFKK